MPTEKPSDRDVGKRRGHGSVRRVVDREVEAAEFFDASLDQRPYGIFVGDIGRHGEYSAATVAQLGRGLLQPVVASGGDCYSGACAYERRCDGRANALAATSDEGHPF